MLLPSLPSEGLLGTILRGVSGAAASLLRQSPPLYLHDSILCLVLTLLPIRQIIRCSIVCKAYRSVIRSDEFRCVCRRNNCRGPLLAAFAHPYVSKLPVAIPHGPFSELRLSLDFGGRDFSFIADSRDGYLLMFTNLAPPHQKFSLCNPLTQMVIDLKMLPLCNEYLVYIASGFIPEEESNDFEVIVLYATGHASRMKTAVYSSKQDDWFFDDHEVEFTVPNCFLSIRQPSILVERQLNFLFKGHHAIAIDMKQSRERCAEKKMQPNLQAVNLSHVPIPIEFQGAGIRLNINNLLGKIGGKLCFIGAPDGGGITTWSFNRTAQGDQVFDEPHELTIAGQASPRMMLLGFAESNEILMVQRSFDSGVILLVNMGTSALSYLVRKIQELHVIAYEMEFPPTSLLRIR